MVTLDQIDKAIGDINKNMATKTEVIELIDKKVTEDAERAKAETKTLYGKAVEEMEEIRKANEQLLNQVKLLRSTRFASIKTPDGMYNGVWGTLELAKNFGLYILSEVAGIPEAKVAFDALGFERRSITANGKIIKAMSGDDLTAGGALTPSEFIPNLIVLMESFGVFRRNTQEWPMGGESSTAPWQSSDVTVYCPGAGATVTKSDPGFRTVGMQSQKWMTLTAVDSELTEDTAIAVGEIVGRSIARAFAKKEDQCAFIGDGTSTYFNQQGARHLLRAVDGTVGNVKGLRVQATPGVWSAIVLGDILALAGLLPGYADDGVDAKWYCHKNFYYTVMIALALAAGGTAANEVVSTGYLRTPSYLGRPVEFTQVMPSVKAGADHCPLLLANLRMGSYLGDRRALTIDQSKEAYFTTDQLGIRGTERIAPIVYGVGDTTDPGPIVGFWADIA